MEDRTVEGKDLEGGATGGGAVKGGAVEGGAVDHQPPVDNSAYQHLRWGCGSWATEKLQELSCKGWAWKLWSYSVWEFLGPGFPWFTEPELILDSGIKCSSSSVACHHI